MGGWICEGELGCDGRGWEWRGTYAGGVVDAAEGEVPGYAPRVGGVGVPVEDYVVGDCGRHCNWGAVAGRMSLVLVYKWQSDVCVLVRRFSR